MNGVASPAEDSARRGNIAPLQIGSVLVDPPVLQAPMAGFTNYAFRQVVREYGGAGLLATEMISARSFHWLDSQEAGAPDRLWGVKEEPRPLAVQIWDNDPGMLAAVGARLAREYKASVVDINFGCPVRRVAGEAGSGSYLLRYPDRVGAIVERVVCECSPTPVTAKIRLVGRGGRASAVDVAKAVESAGAAALTVHGREPEQMFRGRADWDRIAEIKTHLRRMPLIGNGDVVSAEQAAETLRRYGVDGVMIGRAALGRPWLFRQAQAAVRGEPIPPDPTLLQQRDCLLRHFQLVTERFGELKGVLLMRKFACRYVQGLPGARLFRTHAARVSGAEEFRLVVERRFPRDDP